MTVQHTAKSERKCSCGAGFKSRGALRKHLALFEPDQQTVGFAPRVRDFRQRKKKKT